MAWRTTASNTTAAALATAGVAVVQTSPPTTLLQLPPPPIPPKHRRPSLTIPSPTDSPPSSTTEERGKGNAKGSERGKVIEMSPAHLFDEKKGHKMRSLQRHVCYPSHKLVVFVPRFNVGTHQTSSLPSRVFVLVLNNSIVTRGKHDVLFICSILYQCLGNIHKVRALFSQGTTCAIERTQLAHRSSKAGRGSHAGGHIYNKPLWQTRQGNLLVH